MTRSTVASFLHIARARLHSSARPARAWARASKAPLLAFVVASVVGAAVGWATLSHPAAEVYESHFDRVMGTSLDLRLQVAPIERGRDAERVILQEIARQSRILSGYDPESEFSRWMRSAPVPTKVSPELVEVLAAFDEWRARTSGALDPSAEAISIAWTRAASEGRVPTAEELRGAVAQVRQRHWTIDRAASTVTRTSDVPLRLNSFTKSYVVDRAARLALAMPGVSGVLLNAGGDIVVRGDWQQTVGVANPVANADNGRVLSTLSVRDAVVATSGSYKRGFEIAGRHYSHVVDPRSGQPAGRVLSATVVSANAIEAGALATAFCVLTPEERHDLVRTLPDVQFALVLDDGRRVESAGWRGIEVPPPAQFAFPSPVAPVYAAEPAAWKTGAQLTISLELARLDAMGRRPYVAVWIEDKDRFPVRTIALWYDGKARWLPDLRAWYRADRLRSMAEGTQIVDAVTTATRQAGKYTLQWDGKDNAGKPVRAGSYTVCIEAAREHGTYQVIRHDLDVSGGSKHVDLPGGTEISSASLDYQAAGGR